MSEKSYVGKLLDGRYRVVGRAGAGGSARVYRAEDVLMHRSVAMKILDEDETEYCLNSRSFETEVKAISLLSHQNIVTVYDVSMQGSVKYIVMELVDGITLREYLDFHKKLPLAEAVACARQILLALREAHGKGIVHRDIKPQNVMLLQSGQIKVADFGIARLPDRDNFQMSDRSVGTVHYISPEQATTNRVDARSDLYSLGVLMYETVTGVRPFDAKDASVVAMMQVSDAPLPPGRLREDLPPALEHVILRALEKRPEDRYESADAMLRALERAEKHPNSGSPDRVRRRFLARILGRGRASADTAEIDGSTADTAAEAESQAAEESRAEEIKDTPPAPSASEAVTEILQEASPQADKTAEISRVLPEGQDGMEWYQSSAFEALAEEGGELDFDESDFAAPVQEAEEAIEEAIEEATSPLTVAFAAGLEKTDGEPPSTAGKKRGPVGWIAAGIAFLLLVGALVYSGIPFGKLVPRVEVYRGESSLGGLPVYVDYVDSEQPAGTVLLQTPVGGFVRRADAIYLRVSGGPSPYATETVKAALDEHLTGRAEDALLYLTELIKRNPKHPLTVIRVSESSDTVRAGYVIGYSLTTADADNVGGTTLYLYVSSGVLD